MNEWKLVPVEPVAWMYQHDETGLIAFVDQWQIDHGWKMANPRFSMVGPLYLAPLAREPLTNEQIKSAVEDEIDCWGDGHAFLKGVKFAERHHGIRSEK